jgi:thiamine pyrophosphokinase
VGDLDSIRSDVRNYYASHGTNIVKNPDQDTTDFGKAMTHLLDLKRSGQSRSQTTYEDVFIVSSLSGRVDHAIGLLHGMLCEQQRDPALRLWLFSEISVTFVLHPGRNVIFLKEWQRYFTPSVGILPVYGEAVISTKGLEWDVKDWRTSLGTQVSTSNHIVAETVEVETDINVLFTLERKEVLSSS